MDEMRVRVPRKYRIWLLGLLISMPGCALPKRVAYDTARHESKLFLNVNLSPNANQNNPVALDLVLVDDKALLQQLSAMPASQWFQQKTQVERDHPNLTQLKSWEWVPGQVIGPITVRVSPKVKGGIIFAQYFSPGPHRAVIKAQGRLSLDFQTDDFTIQSAK
jgi:type VI secretion system protein